MAKDVRRSTLRSLIAGVLLVPVLLVQSALVAGAAEDLGVWQGEVALSAAPAVVTASAPSTTLTAKVTPAMSRLHQQASVGIYDGVGVLVGSCSTASSSCAQVHASVTVAAGATSVYTAYVVAGALPKTGVPTASLLAEASSTSVTNSGWPGSVSLSVDNAQVSDLAPSAKLTVATDAKLPSPYSMAVYDLDTGRRLSKSCQSSQLCNATQGVTYSESVAVPSNTTKRFAAYVVQGALPTTIPVDAVAATSGVVSVVNSGWTGTVELGVDRSEVDVHDARATVTALTSPGLAGPYQLAIYDVDTQQRVAMACGSGGQKCGDASGARATQMITVTTAATRRFVAYVAQDAPLTALPSKDVRATSGIVTVENVGWVGVVDLTVDRSEVDVLDERATLTARTGPELAGPYQLAIYDADTGVRVSGVCQASTKCRDESGSQVGVVITVDANATRRFVAYVSQDAAPTVLPTKDVRAVSGVVTVENIGWVGAVELSVDRSEVDVLDERATLTARTGPELAGPYQLAIYDADTGVRVSGVCQASTKCRDESGSQVGVVITVDANATRRFVAYVAQDAPPAVLPGKDIRTTSRVVTVENIGWVGVVKLSADASEVDVHDPWVTVTANASPRIAGPYQLAIYDADTMKLVGGACEQRIRCSDESGSRAEQKIMIDTNATRRLVAYVSQEAPLLELPRKDVRATSSVVSVRNVGWHGKVSISAVGRGDDWQSIIATTSPRLAGPYTVSIYDAATQRRVAFCQVQSSCNSEDGTVATFGVLHEELSTYVAYVAQDLPAGSVPVDDVRAISERLSTQWSRPLMPGEVFGGSNPSVDCSQRCHGDPVNTATGEFWDAVTDISLPGVGPVAGVTRSFSTMRREVEGAFGRGWSASFDMRITIAPGAVGANVAEATMVSVVQENGSVVEFVRGEGGRYSTSGRVKATLTRSKDGFVLTRRNTEIFRFDLEGALVAQEDLNGNAVAISRDSAGKVKNLRDDDGRSVTITWLDNRVTLVEDTSGRSVSYRYSSAGDLAAIVGVDGAVRRYTYDDEHRVVTLTDPEGAVTRNVYDKSNRVVEQVDPLGGVMTFDYDEGQTRIVAPDGAVTIEQYVNFQVVSETIAAGTALEGTTFYTYGLTNQVVAETDPLGRVTRTTYDLDGNVTSVRDPLGRVTRMSYDAFGNVLTQTDPTGAQGRARYDERGNLVARIDPAGNTWSFTVNRDGTVAKTREPDGAETSYMYDDHGHPSKVTDPLGAVTRIVNDDLGRQTKVVDPRGTAAGVDAERFTSHARFDDVGRVLSETAPDGGEVTTTYDRVGRPVTRSDATGGVTRWTYDAMGNVKSVVDPTGARTSYTYDKVGRVTSETDSSGAVTATNYDERGRVLTVKDPLGRVTRMEYDAGDRLVASVAPSGARTSFTYDLADQLTQTADPSGASSTYAYDLAGRRVRATDPDGRAVTSKYDSAGRLERTKNHDGTAEYWTYTAAGMPRTHKDAEGRLTTYVHDAAGRLSSLTLPGEVTTTFAYDRAGNLVTRVHPDGETTRYSYDAVGRVTDVTYSDDTPATSTSYDRAGRITKIVDGSGTTGYTYDKVGRPTKVAGPAGAVAYSWSSVGLLESIGYPGGVDVSYDYDRAGQLKTVTDWTGGSYGYSWTQDGQAQSVTYPNGVSTALTLNAAGQVTKSQTGSASATLLTLENTYSRGGLLASQSVTRHAGTRAGLRELRATHTYGYDGRARVKSVAGTATTAIGYDGLGAPTTLPGGRSLKYDGAGRLVQMTTQADSGTTVANLDYDARGNRVRTSDASEETTHTFDLANRLTRVTSAEGKTHAYTYGPGGLRATATHEGNGESRREAYVWDASEVARLLADGAHRYVYGLGATPLAQMSTSSPATVTYLHKDVLGSVRMLTDATGAVVGDADYDVYGSVQSVAALSVQERARFGFAGEYTDPSGYVYLRNRFYDPATASFLSVDPLVSATGTAYGYTRGNPLQYVDPLGLFDVWGAADAFSNGVAGFDDLTFGATSWARWTINEKYLGGCGDVIDASSTAHTAGGALGFAAGLAVPTGYVGRAFGQVSKLLAGSKAGRAANTGTARFVAASDGVVTDLVGSRNAISIGHYPEYVANAQATGARTFSMADDAWNAMSPTEQWVRNQRFLDDAISRGSEIQLATPLSQVRAGSFLERQIGYLSGRGYVPNASGTLMIPGGG